MQARILELTGALAAGLRARDWSVLSPLDSPAERSGILAARHPTLAAGEVVARLAEAGVSVAPRAGAVRFSPHAWNTGDEVARLLESLP
jgi:selenocysteine lyase/cysteine desulfurase